MSDDLEWIWLYGTKRTMFWKGKARGDYYQPGDGVWRVRFWVPGRLQGGREFLVRSEGQAEALLLRMLDELRQAEAEG